MEKRKINPNHWIITFILILFASSATVNGVKLSMEDQAKAILNEIEYKINNPNSDFNLMTQADHHPQKEIDQREASSPTHSRSDSIANSNNPNDQLPYHHHESDHLLSTSNQHSPSQLPSTSTSHSTSQLPSTSNAPPPSPELFNLINQKVMDSIKTYDPNIKLHSLEWTDSQLLRIARTRLHLASERMKQSLTERAPPDHIETIRQNIFQVWSHVLQVMKSADVNQVGIPTEFLKKVIDPVINQLIIRDHNQILTFTYPGQAPVTRIVAIWARFWRSLVNTDPKPILNDDYVSASMDWIINLILNKLPINPTSVLEESSLDPTNIELRTLRFIVWPDGPNVLDELIQDLLNINVRNQAYQFYSVLIKHKHSKVPPTSLSYVMSEADGQYKRQVFNQYKQFRQDQISLRCAVSGLRRSNHQSGPDLISNILARELTQKLRLYLIDNASRMIIERLKSTIESRSPAFLRLSPFSTYLHVKYPSYIKHVAPQKGKTLDYIIDTYLMPLRIWSTIISQMDPQVKVKLGQDMLKFLDIQVRQGIKEEMIYNWIYIIHLTYEDIQLEQRDRLNQVFLKKEIQDWITGKGRSIPPRYLDFPDLNLVSNWLANQLRSSLIKHHELLSLPPVPKFPALNSRQASKGSRMSRPSSSQQVSKSSTLPGSPDSNLGLASQDLNPSPPLASTSHQAENITPVSQFSVPEFSASNPRQGSKRLSMSRSSSPPESPDPNFEIASQDLNSSPPLASTSHQGENIARVPQFSKPNLESDPQELPQKPQPHPFFSNPMNAPKHSIPNRELDSQQISRAPGPSPSFQNSIPVPKTSNPNRKMHSQELPQASKPHPLVQTSMRSPKHLNPNYESDPQEISPAPKPHPFFERLMPLSKNRNSNRQLYSQQISQAPEPHPFVVNSMDAPETSNPNRQIYSQQITQSPEPHRFTQSSKAVPKFTSPNLGPISGPSHTSQPTNSHTFIETFAPPLSLPKFLESSLNDFFEPTLKSRLGTSSQVNEDQEKEIDGFLNDDDEDGFDYDQSHVDNLMNPSKRRRLDG